MADLTDAQRELLAEWLGDWEVIADYSWPLQGTLVLRVRSRGDDLIIKADRVGRHIQREIPAHHRLAEVPGLRGRIPTLRHASMDESLLVTEYLPGELVQGTPAEWDPDVYRQAGELLASFLIPGEVSTDYLAGVRDKAGDLLDGAGELVDPAEVARVAAILAGIEPPAIRLEFTHGDFQPRNWLIHEGDVRLIDFGRAQWRPWTSELIRLRHTQFVGHPELESAFMAGLGRDLDPVDVAALRLEEIAQAIGTVIWAHGIGDADFEEHGRRMISRIR